MNRLISVYLCKELAIATLYVLLAFAALYAIFDLLAAGDNIGKGTYGVNTLFAYVLFRLPHYLYEIFPVAVLIGSLVTMSRLAANSEYAIIRTSGVSAQRIMLILGFFAALCTIITLLIGEWLMPAGDDLARRTEHNALHGQQATLNNQGLWFRSGNDIIEVKEVMPDGSLRGLNRYSLSETHQLTSIQSAQAAQYQPNQQWQAENILATTFSGSQTQTHHQTTAIWLSNINPALLNVLVVEAEEMSIRHLHQYIDHLQENRQDTLKYRVALWRKVFYPFAAFAMVLIALAFTPVLARHSNLGWRIFFGMCLGVGFHFIGRFFGFYAELFKLPAIIAGGMPVVVFIAFAFFAARYGQKQQR